MRYSTVLFCIVASIAGAGCGWLDDRPAPVDGAAYTASGQLSNARLTTAHDSFGSAVNEYFGLGSKPQQPIEFPHNTHIEKGLTCTEYCHEAVTKGPQAGRPEQPLGPKRQQLAWVLLQIPIPLLLVVPHASGTFL